MYLNLIKDRRMVKAEMTERKMPGCDRSRLMISVRGIPNKTALEVRGNPIR